MRLPLVASAVALMLSMPTPSIGQAAPRTLVAVFAHADDEGAVSPVLARYAREGVQVHVIVATDGAQGGSYTSIPRGPELARVRSEEMLCATKALGTQPPVQLGFPDGELGTTPPTLRVSFSSACACTRNCNAFDPTRSSPGAPTADRRTRTTSW